MKKLYTLKDRKDFKVCEEGFDGGKGIFIKGKQKGMTVIWSYAGGWEHVSILFTPLMLTCSHPPA